MNHRLHQGAPAGHALNPIKIAISYSSIFVNRQPLSGDTHNKKCAGAAGRVNTNTTARKCEWGMHVKAQIVES